MGSIKSRLDRVHAVAVLGDLGLLLLLLDAVDYCLTGWMPPRHALGPQP